MSGGPKLISECSCPSPSTDGMTSIHDWLSSLVHTPKYHVKMTSSNQPVAINESSFPPTSSCQDFSAPHITGHQSYEWREDCLNIVDDQYAVPPQQNFLSTFQQATDWNKCHTAMTAICQPSSHPCFNLVAGQNFISSCDFSTESFLPGIPHFANRVTKSPFAAPFQSLETSYRVLTEAEHVTPANTVQMLLGGTNKTEDEYARSTLKSGNYTCSNPSTDLAPKSYDGSAERPGMLLSQLTKPQQNLIDRPNKMCKFDLPTSHTFLHCDYVSDLHVNFARDCTYPHDPVITSRKQVPQSASNELACPGNEQTVYEAADSSVDVADFKCERIKSCRSSAGKYPMKSDTAYQHDMCHYLTNSHYLDQAPDISGPTKQTLASSSTYFWQYNSQCKGPKAIRLVDLEGPVLHGEQTVTDQPDSTAGFLDGLALFDSGDQPVISVQTTSTASLPEYPFVVFEDPVQRRYDLVHCSKLRRGDGNDVTPNLPRLRAMGEELETLNQQLIEHGEIIVAGTAGGPTSLTSMFLAQPEPFTKLSSGLSPLPLDCKMIEQAKREKNKLASKICRLKKKAFHEANKIKYTGLEKEYYELTSVIVQLRRLVTDRLRTWYNTSQSTVSLCTAYPSQDHPFDQSVPTEPHNIPKFVSAAPGRGVTMADINNSCRIPPYYINNTSLTSHALHIYENTHMTHAASRTDALVEEILRIFRAGQTSHPLVRGLAIDDVSPTIASTSEPVEATQVQSINFCPTSCQKAAVTYKAPSKTSASFMNDSDYLEFVSSFHPPPKFTVSYLPDNQYI
ncbi:hypothetical protein CRM22_004319 [Opisthorchis felineus]|uniref:BZIP domain-containing protein n=1 Tax=Opisthorchis felineus TaxID=147828 RepID=A0A4S2M244_OPIFE|nr:hypothetical protein CRM22_004319 [Opisthorchis felineus]